MTTQTFTFNATISLSAEQQADAYKLRKAFPGFVKDAKGGERGGLNIRLHDDGTEVTIGATKKSFINVITHKIEEFYRNQYEQNHRKSTPPPSPKESINRFQGLEEKEPDTHVVMFGRYRIPLTPGTNFRINGAGGCVGTGQFQGPTANDLRQATNELLAMSSRDISGKTPTIGKAKKNVVPSHSWDNTDKVFEGSGLINPPRPDNWFGLSDIEEFTASAVANKRREKQETKAHTRFRNREETDENGNIVDLEEFIRARDEEEQEEFQNIIDLKALLEEDEDPEWNEPSPAVEETYTAGDDVPDDWEDEA